MSAYDDSERLRYFGALVSWFVGWAGAGYLYENTHLSWVRIAAGMLLAVCVVMTFRTGWLWRRAVRRNPRPKRID